MRAILVEISRGATIGTMIGLIIGLLASFLAQTGYYVGLWLLVLLGIIGAGVVVLMTVFRFAFEMGGLRRMAIRALGGAIVGIVLGPLLFLWGWSDRMITGTLGIVVILVVFAALNEALDILSDRMKEEPRVGR